MTDSDIQSQLISKAGNEVQHESLGVLPSLSSRAMFWRPKYLCPSDWLDHLPFAFWLIESVKPAVLVELGVGTGASYFAFCQAMDKLNVDGRCFGIDQWQHHGNTSDAKRTEWQAVAAYNQIQYEEFSKILDDDAFQAASLFLDGSVDLLHLNMADATIQLDILFNLWLPKLSDKAVVLLHHSQNTQIQQLRDLKASLAKGYIHFEFLHQHGLLVVQLKKSPSERFSRLMNVRPGEKTFEIVQTVFARLGKACSATLLADVANTQIQHIQTALADSQQELQQRQSRIDALMLELSEHKQWLAERDQKLQHISHQLVDHEQQKNEHTKTLEQRIQLLERLRTELKTEVETLFSHLEQSSQENAELKTQLLQQQQQTQQAREDSVQTQQQLTSVQDQATALQAEVSQLKQLLNDSNLHLLQQQQQTQQAREDSVQTQQQLTSAQDQATALQAEVSQLKQLLNDANQQQLMTHEQLQSLTVELATTSQQLDDSQNVLADVTKQKADDTARYSAALQEREAKIQQLAEQLSQREQQFEQHQAEYEEALTLANKQMLDKNNQLQLATQQIDAVLINSNEQDKKIRDLTEQLSCYQSESEHRISALEAELSVANKLVADKNVLLGQMQNQVDELTLQFDRMETSKKQLDKQLAVESSERAELTIQLANLVKDTEHKLALAQQESTARIAELASLSKIYKESQDEVARYKKLCGEKGSGLSYFAEAVQTEHGYITEVSMLSRQLQQLKMQHANEQAKLQAELHQLNKQLTLFKTSSGGRVAQMLNSVLGVGKMPQSWRKDLELVAATGLFDENWYLTQYPDVVSANVAPLEHYIRFGGFEGRNPNPDFDSAFYLSQYPDVVAGGMNPLVHFVKFGRQEQRLTSSHVMDSIVESPSND